jgi:hypothetical protein
LKILMVAFALTMLENLRVNVPKDGSVMV